MKMRKPKNFPKKLFCFKWEAFTLIFYNILCAVVREYFTKKGDKYTGILFGLRNYIIQYIYIAMLRF